MLDVPVKHEKKSSSISQPHDKLVRKLLSNAASARDILTLYLPDEVRKIVDLNYLEYQKETYITGQFKEQRVDLLFKTLFQNEEGYIYVLLEHQSYDDKWLPLRIFQYMGTIWDHLKKNTKNGKIPLIYPLIIYNGRRPYAQSVTMRDLIYPETSQKMFDDFFKTPFHLVDLNKIEDAELRAHMQEHVRGIALLLTIKHVHRKDSQEVFEGTLLEPYKILDESGNRDDVADMLYYLLNEGNFLNKEKFWRILHQEFSAEVEVNVTTIAQQLRSEGRAEGRAEGFERGTEKTQKEVAERLLSENCDLVFIAKMTGLPIAKLRELQKQSH